MSRVFLDTSAYSAFRRGHQKVHYRLKEAPQILVSPVVLGELHVGFARGRRTAENRDELASFLASPRVDVAHIDEAVAERYALILEYLRGHGTPIPTNDLWIAAGAMTTGAPLMTLDRHFQRAPQIVVELFEPEDSHS